MTGFTPLAIGEVIEFVPARFADARGWFMETWSKLRFGDAGIDADWVQDNHSLSRAAGTVRGLHFQLPPAAQSKLVRVVRGAVFDVAVDIRAASPTYGRWVATELSAEKGNQLFIPEGFAHGFMTLAADTEVAYKVSSAYSPAHERAIAWNDPDIGIDWPDVAPVELSAKDDAAPAFRDLEASF